MSSVNLQEIILSPWIFRHNRDMKRIHIVRRFTPVRTTTATLAVLASCDASPSGRPQTRRVHCHFPYVGRPSVPCAPLPSP